MAKNHCHHRFGALFPRKTGLLESLSHVYYCWGVAQTNTLKIYPASEEDIGLFL